MKCVFEQYQAIISQVRLIVLRCAFLPSFPEGS